MEEECESERESLGAGGRDEGLGIRGAMRGPIPNPLAFWFWFWFCGRGAPLLATAAAAVCALLAPARSPSARGALAATAGALLFETDEERELSSEGTDADEFEFDSTSCAGFLLDCCSCTGAGFDAALVGAGGGFDECFALATGAPEGGMTLLLAPDEA